MKVIIAAGGTINESMLSFFQERNNEKVIGVDKGVEFLYQHRIEPDYIVGDFDSLDASVLEHYKQTTPIKRLVPEKDATDTQVGLELAMEMGADEIVIIGGTGSRLDHVLGNIQILSIPLEKGIKAYIQDSNNRIQLMTKQMVIEKEHMFGRYISLLPLTDCVEGVTLQGFKYPLNKFTLTSNNSLGISNEVIEDKAYIAMTSGVLIVIQSKD